MEAAYCHHGQCYHPVDIINFTEIICQYYSKPLKLSLWLMVSFSLVQSDHIEQCLYKQVQIFEVSLNTYDFFKSTHVSDDEAAR